MSAKRLNAAWNVPGALAALLFLLGPLLGFLRVLAPLAAFMTFAASVVPAAVALLVGVYALTRGLHRRGLVAAGLGLVPLATVAAGLMNGRAYPPINDITTNLDNPPRFLAAAAAPDNAGKDLGYPDDFRAIVQGAYPDLISLQLSMPPDAAFELARKVAAGRPGWRLVRIDQAALTFEGEDTSRIFRFTDDFVVRVSPLDGRAQVDMRSRSRVGKGDLGANANRIRSYYADVAAEALTDGVRR